MYAVRETIGLEGTPVISSFHTVFDEALTIAKDNKAKNSEIFLYNMDTLGEPLADLLFGKTVMPWGEEVAIVPSRSFNNWPLEKSERFQTLRKRYPDVKISLGPMKYETLPRPISI